MIDKRAGRKNAAKEIARGRRSETQIIGIQDPPHAFWFVVRRDRAHAIGHGLVTKK